jgi:hypothetical protein
MGYSLEQYDYAGDDPAHTADDGQPARERDSAHLQAGQDEEDW